MRLRPTWHATPLKFWWNTCFFWLFALGTPPAAQAADKVFRIGWEPWAPFQHIVDGKPTGLDLECVKAIFERAGLPYELKSLPWKRQLEMLKDGELEVLPGAVVTEERKAFATFTDPYYSAGYNAVFIRAKDAAKHANVKTLEDIVPAGFKLGANHGYEYGGEFAELYKDEKFKKHLLENTQVQQNVKMLESGRIDGLVIDVISGRYELEKIGFYKDTKILFRLEDKPTSTYFMLSKKTVSADEVARINAAIKATTADGTIQKILDRYVPEL